MMLIYYLLNLFIGLISLKIILKKGFYLRNPLYFFYIFFFFILVVIGSIYVYFPSLSPYQNADYFSITFFIVLFTAQLVQLFFLLCLSLKRPLVTKKITTLDQIKLRKKYYIFPFLLCLMIVSTSIYSNGIPIFFKLIFSGFSAKNIVIERSLYFENQSSFFINQIGFYIAPLLMTIYSYILKVNFPILKHRLFYFANFLIGVALSLSFFHKTPLVIFVLSIITLNILFKKKRISLKKIVLITLVLFSIIIIQYAVILQNQNIDSFSSVLNGIINRIIGVYPLQIAVSIDIISQTGYLYGGTIPNFFGLFNHTPINISRMIHYEIFQMEGNAPPPAVGYAYANFGLLGVFFDTIFMSLFLVLFNQFVLTLKNFYVQVLIVIILIPKIMYVSMSSIYDSLLNPRDFIVYGVIFFIILSKIKTSE